MIVKAEPSLAAGRVGWATPAFTQRAEHVQTSGRPAAD
jgi:hypothetical protein